VSETTAFAAGAETNMGFRTAETFVDGWVRTGDEVIIKNNEIFVVDRVKVASISWCYSSGYYLNLAIGNHESTRVSSRSS
jgi:acyl-CoA synthetase (AMP-forming)/AMP-acid ligase II